VLVIIDVMGYVGYVLRLMVIHIIFIIVRDYRGFYYKNDRN
jgi:hypothetical protein